ncbi:flagellar basal body L-ring protein FlgH [Kumtagia ephedrae]|jgi:flagellar L-ring protein precursor FlgH|uniref:Flagellar L-ring protein n=1 Tax=Kumtagia ephedrae TaxID=2116701 RepID=A0A2P7SLK1_9HYPH|nr:flagellar basal body L-ring protein FlgH [Mesorhizobium ephedrae]PSJ63337.1 flagellar basal body L-ring protein [Mesorhizobium ephedrae]
MMTRLSVLGAVVLLAGCANNMKELGREPALSPVGAGVAVAPQSAYSYAKPAPPPAKRFSLWNDRQSRFFTDPRAIDVGDVLTVNIRINDRARFKNESDRSRRAERSMDIGLAGDWNGVSGAVAGTGSVESTTSTDSTGATARSEDMVLNVAAVVTDVMPNGNLLIRGSQEVRVNAELRVLTIAGIVRPKDIGPENTISYERIAEARISYGGRGRLTEVQQPAWGQQVADQILPF